MEVAGYLQMFFFVVVVFLLGLIFVCQNSRKSSPCIDRTPGFTGVSYSGGLQPNHLLAGRHSFLYY